MLCVCVGLCIRAHACPCMQVLGAILVINKNDSENEHDIFFEDCYTEVRARHGRLGACGRCKGAAS